MDNLESNDYEVRLRSQDESVKYMLTLSGKTIHVLNSDVAIDALQNRPIVCSFADMEFKFPKNVLQNAYKQIQKMPVQFGYTKATKAQRKVLIQWIKKRYYENFNPQYMVLYGGILPLYFGILTQLTQENDQVLVFSPGYYRFLVTLKQTKRKPVECILKTRDSQNGRQFYIDFKELQQIFQTHKIKLVVWVSPYNPTGRIWTKQQSQQLVNLVKKHGVLLFSDQIYGDSLLDVTNFTSMLKQEEIHQNLIWTGSFTKTFNCSGSAMSHVYIPNQQIRKKMQWYLDYAYAYPNSFSVKLMTSCYTIGEQWRVNTMKYIQNNYKFFKQQCKQKLPKLIVFNLQCAYLIIVDFKNYELHDKEIQQLMNSVNVYPTYFTACYLNSSEVEITTCRISLAIKRSVVQEIINRISAKLEN